MDERRLPYVKKHYGSGNMQKLQQDMKKAGVVWLSIISSAPGKQGYVSGAEADALTRSRGAKPTAVLLDPKGDVGRLYEAQTTPHIFVVDKTGVLRYMGAIDDQPTTEREKPRQGPQLRPRRSHRPRRRQTRRRNRDGPLRLQREVLSRFFGGHHA